MSEPRDMWIVSLRAPHRLICRSNNPTKFELVINMTASKTVGITFPVTLLARADRVID